MEDSRIVWTALESGTFFARVAHFDRSYDPHTAPLCGNHYRVAVETPLCEPVDDQEPDSYYTEASTIPASGEVFTRAINTVGDKDWIRFYAQAGQAYTVTTSRLDPDVDTVLQLYDRDGVTLLQENDDYDPESSSKASRIRWTAPESGWYFARVSHFDTTYDPRYAEVCGSRYAIAVEQEILGLNKFGRAQDDKLEPGDTIDYTIVVWNKLNMPQTNIAITDTIPLYTTYVTGSVRSNLGKIFGPDPLIVKVPVLDVGGRVTVTFQVRVNEDAIGQTITNRAEASSDQQGARAYTPEIVTKAYYPVYLPVILEEIDQSAKGGR